MKNPGSHIKPSTKVPANAGRSFRGSEKPISKGGKAFAGAGNFSAGHDQPLLAPARSDQKRTY